MLTLHCLIVFLGIWHILTRMTGQQEAGGQLLTLAYKGGRGGPANTDIGIQRGMGGGLDPTILV